MRIFPATRRAFCRVCPAPCTLQADEDQRRLPETGCPLKTWEPVPAGGRALSLSHARPQRTGTVEPPEVWGPRLWAEIHTWALTAPVDPQAARAYVGGIWRRLPVCDCRSHLMRYLAAHPFPYDAPPALRFAYTVGLHNDVRRRQSKPEMSVEDALAEWQPKTARA
jgi:hypothetical protein